MNLEYQPKKSILLRWIQNVYRAGGTSSVANRHINKLADLLDLKVLSVFLPGRVQLYITDKSTNGSKNNAAATDGVVDSAALSPDADASAKPISIVSTDSAGDLVSSDYEESDFTMISVSWGFNLPLIELMENDLEKIINNKAKGIKVSLPYLESLVSGYCAFPALYSSWQIVLACGVLSGTMAYAFFGGDWYDGLLTFVLGAIAGAFVVLCDYKPFSFNILHELISSFVISLLSLLAALTGCFHFWPMVLAGTIWILPGFSMVIGFVELVRKFHLTGLIQHASALFVALIMAVGFTLSLMFTNDLLHVSNLDITWPSVTGSALRTVMRFVLCAIFAVACSVIYHSPPRHFLLSIPAALFCFSLVVLGEIGRYPDELVAFPFALLTTLFCRVIAGLSKQTHLAPLYVAILPLVPGSRVVRSSFRLLTSVHGYILRTEQFPDFSSSIFISIAVAFGVFAADSFYSAYVYDWVIKPTRRYLKSKKIVKNDPERQEISRIV